MRLDQYYRKRLRTPNYGAYVSDTYDDQYIQNIVGAFEDFGDRQNLNDVGIINEMMEFVQNLQYTTDEVSAGYNEYPKYPIETLVDKEGDCEDSSILLSSMLDQFGYGSVLLIFKNQQHAAVGVAGDPDLEGTYYEQGGQRYYYTETTAPGYRIGQLPPDMEVGNPEITPVNDSGVLVFSYAVDTPSEGGASVEITMRNVGDGTGSAKAQAAFKNRSQQRVVSAVSDATQLSPNEEHTVTLDLEPPDDQDLRAEVGVVMDGILQDRLRSEFREPVDSGNMG
ncbi:copper amine oxidase [Haloarcula sp. S1CR25-12]|uniref:Copper amine oxidase n=1 Tax=Haloarcula saliterrae TaxID=2950534 RepID=A0ABU2FAS3_9EURY|nr:copper amine oxidase [Haloarcula sp. S1CR25-12]MDS0258916.1 copper amine oxidase [Haloarcula sp. S1CR25-12]